MNISRMLKNLIAALAVLNIIAMMVFQYGLPSLYWSATNDIEETNQWNLGTIEAVEKEEAIKEEEVAESFLARDEGRSEEESEEADTERDPDAPILELTDDHIYLKVGDRFNYMSYIKTMVDVDGSDLSHYIYLNRDVDTSEPGDIELIYRITSTITGKSTAQALLVTIQE